MDFCLKFLLKPNKHLTLAHEGRNNSENGIKERLFSSKTKKSEIGDVD